MSHLYYTTIVRKNDRRYLNQTRQGSFNSNCKKRYKSDNCYRELYFNQLGADKRMLPINYLRIDSISDADPSFIMISKPRMNTFDFITYIMGALGS